MPLATGPLGPSPEMDNSADQAADRSQLPRMIRVDTLSNIGKS